MGSGRDGGRSPLMTIRLSIVIPVYNEGEGITAVLRDLQLKVQSQPFEVLVVYDFDEDTTVPVVRRLSAHFPELRLVRNRRGRGVANALKTGFSTATGRHVLVMMGDASDEAAAIDDMVARAELGADVVAASRYMPGGRQLGGPFVKRILSQLAGRSLYWLGALPIHDPTSNYKLYSRRLLNAVEIESTGGFEVALELTVKACRMGCRVAEIPTTWHDRTAGTSRFQLRKWLPRYLRWYAVALNPVGRHRAPVIDAQERPEKAA
jgi:dolichol-phosphate mannosyltransferase